MIPKAFCLADSSGVAERSVTQVTRSDAGLSISLLEESPSYTVDLGKIPVGEITTVRLNLKGSLASRSIEAASASCGCMSTALVHSKEDGKARVVSIALKPKTVVDNFGQRVTLRLNAPSDRSIVVNMSAAVTSPIELSTKTFRFDAKNAPGSLLLRPTLPHLNLISCTPMRGVLRLQSVETDSEELAWAYAITPNISSGQAVEILRIAYSDSRVSAEPAHSIDVMVGVAKQAAVRFIPSELFVSDDAGEIAVNLLFTGAHYPNANVVATIEILDEDGQIIGDVATESILIQRKAKRIFRLIVPSSADLPRHAAKLRLALEDRFYLLPVSHPTGD